MRREWLPAKFNEQFYRERLPLRSGGVFDFDAVNADKSIAVTISTSASKTASGKYGVAKMNKIRSDVLFLTMAETSKRFVVLTDRSMYDQCMKDRIAGRLPLEIEFLHAVLPAELAAKLAIAQRSASDEVRPK